MILIPEVPFDLNEVCNTIRKRHARGKTFSIVVVAEGAKLDDDSMVLQSQEKDAFGHVRLGGIGNLLSDEIERRTGYESRATVLGHIQRGGSPSAYDRVLGTRFGIAAIDLVHEDNFGKMVALRGQNIVAIDLQEGPCRSCVPWIWGFTILPKYFLGNRRRIMGVQKIYVGADFLTRPIIVKQQV